MSPLGARAPTIKFLRPFAQWINDRRWAANLRRARAWRRTLIFSKRKRFDEELRPKLEPGAVIAYPDAFYEVTTDDLLRAMRASMQEGRS